jgi:hypothetical protein
MASSIRQQFSDRSDADIALLEGRLSLFTDKSVMVEGPQSWGGV